MRFTFKKEERLYGRVALDAVYLSGKHFSNSYFKFIFLKVEVGDEPPCRVVFSVPKKNFKKAVDRNRIKRQMRETYRLQKHHFYQQLSEKKTQLHLYVIYSGKRLISFADLQESLVKGIQMVVSKL